MIELEGNQRVLYQWDLNKRIVIDGFPAGTIVEFSFKYDCKDSALLVKAYAEGEHVYADIPNSLLQHHGYIRAFVRPSANAVDHEPAIKDIKVTRREKPEDYYYSETPTLSYEELAKRVEALEGEGLANAVADYLKENPVQAGATKEEAAQIQQNKTDIEQLTQNKLDANKLPEAVNDALAQAQASGAFKGEKGERGEPGQPGEKGADGQPGADGDDYVLTPADKQEIAELTAPLVYVPSGGSNHPLTFTGAVNATYDGSEAVSVEIPVGGGGGGTWELIGEVTSDGAGDQTGISVPCDLSQYKQVYVHAYNLTPNTKFRVVMRSQLIWTSAPGVFGYNALGVQNSSPTAYLTGHMNNIWSITGIAYNISGRIAAYGAAEAKYNGGHALWRQGYQNGELMGVAWDEVKYISLDRNSATDTVPEGCALAVWGCK